MTETFQQYRRSQIAELRPYTKGEALSDRVSISASDLEAGSPKPGDMIARNPKNHDDQWLVAAKYFADNFEPVSPQPTETLKPLTREELLDLIGSACDGYAAKGRHTEKQAVVARYTDAIMARLPTLDAAVVEAAEALIAAEATHEQSRVTAATGIVAEIENEAENAVIEAQRRFRAIATPEALLNAFKGWGGER